MISALRGIGRHIDLTERRGWRCKFWLATRAKDENGSRARRHFPPSTRFLAYQEDYYSSLCLSSFVRSLFPPVSSIFFSLTRDEFHPARLAYLCNDVGVWNRDRGGRGGGCIVSIDSEFCPGHLFVNIARCDASVPHGRLDRIFDYNT